ncbi:MAG: twin-arginine translocase TatA/TatE family subunit [Coriobacteriia bacterium]|nr:twin-arginine translocase TatA/TatE family subunit [Coriobacteriia bacterium]
MAAFGIPNGPELWIILGIVLLLFGPTQLPKLAKMFGKSAKALKEGMDEGMNAIDEEATTKKAEKVDKVESTDSGSDS